MAERDRYDPTIETYLRQRGAHEMPMGLADEVLRVAATTPQETGSRFWPRLPRLALATAAAAFAAAVFILQLSPPPVGEDAPTGRPSQSPPPSASPAPSPTATDEPGITTGEHARVTVEQLEARHERSDEAPVVAALAEGDRVYVVEGPIAAEEAVWYRVQHPAHRYTPSFVWVSFENQQEAHSALEPFEPRCPGAPIDMELFDDLTAMERLLCFGVEPITIGPIHVLGGEGGEEEPVGEPGWLVNAAPWELYTAFNWPNATTQGSLSGRVEPGTSPQLASEAWFEIVGTLDHPDARGCSRQLSEPEYGESDDLAELWCRQQFVIIEATRVPAPPED
ncbi:MAG: hypothetical protein ACR2I5_03060 [Candidatus Limnocylindria bacterium]